MKYKSVIRTVLAWVIALIIVLPFFWIIMLSFKSNSEILINASALPEGIRFDNYRSALNTLPFLTMLKNTFINVILVVLLTFVIVYPCSYAIAKIPFKHPILSKLLYGYLICGLIIPSYILIFPVYRVNLILGTIGTRAGLILPLVATNFSFDTLLFVGALKKLPAEIEEAAIIDGCGLFKLLTRITVPMIAPTFFTVMVFNVLYIWNEYLFSSLFITKKDNLTLAMGIRFFQGQYSMDYAGMIAATILIMLPQLLFYIVFQKWIVKGLTDGAVKA